MKQELRARRMFAGLLSLVMLASLLAVPVLADEEVSAPVAETAPAVTVEAPAKEEAPVVKTESPAAKDEAPVKDEPTAPAGDAPVKAETPAKDDAPTVEETPNKNAASPAEDETAPAVDEPAGDETPAPSAEPVQDEPAQEELTTTVAPVAPRRPSRLPAVVLEEDPAGDAPETDAPAVQASTGSSAVAEPDDQPSAADDGFTLDWDEVGLLDGGDWQMGRWGVARGQGGYWVYMENDQPQARLGITYYNSSSDAIAYQAWIADGQRLLNEGGFPIPGAALTVVNDGGSVRMEGFVPDSFFKDTRFILSSGSVTLESEDIALLEGVEAPVTDEDPVSKEPKVTDPNASYQGIVIDGDFSDWDAVPRYDIDDILDVNGYPKTGNTVDQVSVMWDGDTIYILLVANGVPADYDPSLMVGNWNSVCGAGPNGNGQFAIKTDLGGELLIQPTAYGEPAIAGVNDAQVAVNNKNWAGAPHMWEIAIPASKLPTYLESFDFGLYMVAPTISGITDFQTGKDEDKTFHGIVYDGNIEDWTYYPNYRIEYATPGTQDVVRDAHGALWANDGILYGYALSNMEKHLAEEGSCFLDAITLAFNGDRSYKEHPTDGNFYPRLVSFESGAPVVVNDGTHLAPGDHVFYIFDERTAPDAPIYNNETGEVFYPDNAYLMAHAFGQMTVHVDGVKDYAEFELYLDRVAEYIDKDADTAFKTIEIQWGRLGQQWISYAGTPTGPAVSVALLVGAVCLPMGYVELKKRRRAKGEAAQ